MKQNRKALLLLCLLSMVIILASTCMNKTVESNDPRGPQFAGAAPCRQCHQPVYDAYINTAHYNTTAPASKKSISGSFAAGSNRFTVNDSTFIEMQDRDSGLYQALYVNKKEKEAQRFDIQFGVKHAQTFLYWKGDQTFELPLSFYHSTNSWGTSPGYPLTQLNFSRVIGANCFECHSSFIESRLNITTTETKETLKKNTLIYGIDCERCHGPALAHVNFHRENANETKPMYITRYATLSRQQKLDACAVCHSGNDKLAETSTFKFMPGDTLAHFFINWNTQNTSAKLDVHGNQYQLLAQSLCFKNTRTLDCSTCHNPHTNASNNIKTYSAICNNCHQSVTHSFVKDKAAETALKTNCIDCHMPKQASQAITFQVSGSTEKSAYLLRTHNIAVYGKENETLSSVQLK